MGSGTPGGPGTGIQPSARGVFYINPSRRGPVPGPGPSGPGGSEKAQKGLPAQNPRISGRTPKTPKIGVSRGLPTKARKSGYRAPPRGVDVKPPSSRVPESAKRARFGQNGQKVLFWAKMPILGIFWCFGGLFRPLGAPRDPFRGVAFTSTPRGGALWPLPGVPGGLRLGAG